MRFILVLLIGLMLHTLAPAAPTMTVACSTSTFSGTYAPDGNVAVIWVMNNSVTKRIKTIGLFAGIRSKWLLTWKAMTAQAVDGLTGATRASMQNGPTAISTSWNLTDTASATVPVGTYRVYVEMTESHSQGALAWATLPLTGRDTTLTQFDSVNILGSHLYGFKLEIKGSTAAETAIPKSATASIRMTPNPFSKAVSFQYGTSVKDEAVDILDLSGRVLAHPVNGSWDGKDLKGIKVPQGVYLVRAKLGNRMVSERLTLIR